MKGSAWPKTFWTLALVLCLPGSGLAQSPWDLQKGNCDAYFAKPEEASLEDLKYCTALWEAYRDVSNLKPGEKETVARAFNRLYREGDPEASYLAKCALSRLGFAPEEVSPEEAKKRQEVKGPARKKYRPHKATPEEHKAAEALRAKAMKEYKKRRWREAIALLEMALEKDGAYVQALYDMACCYALLGDKENAVEYLMRLSDLGTKEAVEKLRKARKDKDFQSIREEPAFKRATGYARVKVFNGILGRDREIGEDNVYQLVEMLRNEKLGYEVVEGGDDKHARDRPYIWYKEHSKLQAYVIRKLIGHPKTRLLPWPPDKMDLDYDIAVTWADKVEKDETGERKAKYALKGSGPDGQSIDPEKRIDQALREQDEALRKPEEYARKVENVIDTPKRIESKAESAVDRVESTVEKIERVGDKAGKIFGR